MHVYEFVFLSAARRLSKLKKKTVHVPHPQAPQYTAPHGWSLAGIARGVASPPVSAQLGSNASSSLSLSCARAAAQAKGRGTNTHGFCWRAPAGCLVSSRTRAGARSISSSGSARRSGNERGSAAGVGTERRTNEAPGRACGTRVSHPARRRRCLGRHAHMRLNSLVIPPVARVPVAGRP